MAVVIILQILLLLLKTNMNILVIGKFSQDQFGFHISDTLKDMGHLTIEFDPSKKYKYTHTTLGRRVHQLNHLIISSLTSTPYFRERRKGRLEKLIREKQIDLTIITHDFLYPDEAELIKEKTKSPLVLWFPDSVAGFQKGLFFISAYDFLFFKDPYIVKVLSEQYNLKNVFYLPECCNPKFHKPVELSQNDIEHYGCDITTFGNPHNIRSSIFKQLLELNYSIKIWGHQPPVWLSDNKIKSLYTGEYVFNESKAKSVLAAKINLNTLLPAEIYGLNARTFEIAGIGGFQMLHWRASLSNLFDEGKELVTFNNFLELREKIDFYIHNNGLRNEIAKAGQKRAYSDHTYKIRLACLIETVFSK